MLRLSSDAGGCENEPDLEVPGNFRRKGSTLATISANPSDTDKIFS